MSEQETLAEVVRDYQGALGDAHRRTHNWRDRAEAAEAAIEQAKTWIDEAPEHTPGLDLLRQILAPPAVPAEGAGGEGS